MLNATKAVLTAPSMFLDSKKLEMVLINSDNGTRTRQKFLLATMSLHYFSVDLTTHL